MPYLPGRRGPNRGQPREPGLYCPGLVPILRRQPDAIPRRGNRSAGPDGPILGWKHRQNFRPSGFGPTVIQYSARRFMASALPFACLSITYKLPYRRAVSSEIGQNLAEYEKKFHASLVWPYVRRVSTSLGILGWILPAQYRTSLIEYMLGKHRIC